MNYSQWITRVCDLLEIIVVDATSATPTSSSDFNNIYPAAIDYVENRLQRDLQLINTLVTTTSSLTANSRSQTVPVSGGTYVVISQLALTISGTRQPPLIPASYEALGAMYPTDASLIPAPSIPLYWAPFNGTTVLVGPSPDTTYGIETTGTIRVNQLSSSNTTNFLSTSLPDMYVAGSMVFFAGWQANYGAMSDNPQQAQSWEAQYQTLLKSATGEEFMKKFQSAGWTAKMPPSIATPPQS